MDETLLKDKNVLVVEDDLISQFIVKHILSIMGASAEVAGSGNEAIRKMQTHTFDLVLMDIQLPQMNGFEITQYIRNQLKNNVPIIGMTAFAVESESNKGLALGMNDYVSKPITIEGLCSAVKKIVHTPQQPYVNPYILSNNQVTVDISMLYEIAGDDLSYINLMISTFVENMPGNYKAIENSFEANDYDGLHKAAHFAKSSLSIIKVSDTLSLVEKIEQIAKTKTGTEALPLLLQQLKEKLEAAEKILAEKLSTATV